MQCQPVKASNEVPHDQMHSSAVLQKQQTGTCDQKCWATRAGHGSSTEQDTAQMSSVSNSNHSSRQNDPCRVVCDAGTVKKQGTLTKAVTKGLHHTHKAKGKAGEHLALCAPHGSRSYFLCCSPNSFGSCRMLPGPFELQCLHLPFHKGCVLCGRDMCMQHCIH